LRRSASPAPLTQSVGKETKLSSLQTIQARSAALHSDGQQAKPATPKPLTVAQSQVAQRQPKRDASGQGHEQGIASRGSKNATDKAGGSESIPSSSAPAAEPGAQTVTPSTPASKRARRVSVQAEGIESSHPGSDRAPSDAVGPESAGALQSSGIGGPLSQGDSLPDIFAGLNEADAGTLGLIDDLSDVDGGGLPGAGQKTPQKSRR
jgi:hypothetical protein